MEKKQSHYIPILLHNTLKKILFVILLFPALFNCQAEGQSLQYPDQIGDIEFDPTTDKKDFSLCSARHIFQYFNDSNGLQYKGEKIEINKMFFSQYKNQNIPNETGLIRIRFVVNCKGETDRFRTMGMNEKYKPKTFSSKITAQLMNITKSLNGWNLKKIQNHDVDYYQYLIFKIENGNLIEIMP